MTSNSGSFPLQLTAGGGAGVGDVSVRQAEFEVLNVVAGIRGRDDPDSPFLAEALPRASWDPDNKTGLRNVERVVLVLGLSGRYMLG